MENVTSILMGFPSESGYPSDEAYDDAAISHLKQIEKLLFTEDSPTGELLTKNLKVNRALNVSPICCVLTRESRLAPGPCRLLDFLPCPHRGYPGLPKLLR